MKIAENIDILHLGAGPALIDSGSFRNKFYVLSRFFAGDIITPVSFDEHNDLNTPIQMGAFALHPVKYIIGNAFFRNMYTFSMLTLKAMFLFYIKKRRFKAVISPNPLIAGIASICIAQLTGAKSIIEINGNFEKSFKYSRCSMSITDRLKERLALALIPYVMKKADILKTCFDEQVDSKIKSRVKTVNFADYVPVEMFFKAEKSDGKYILLLGYPWFLKGVDILIEAFKMISPQYPEYKLKIVGWCPEGKEFFENLAKDNPQIELGLPVYYDEAVKLIAGCSLYVLASRTDAKPRVLIEAMAAGKPVIASRVDGVPELITDGKTGLLFEMGNAAELAEKIKVLLNNKNLSDTLGRNAKHFIIENLTEESYAEKYLAMVESVIK